MYACMHICMYVCINVWGNSVDMSKLIIQLKYDR